MGIGDNSFIESFNKKEKDGWSKLYDYYYSSLCNYVSRLVEDDHAAVDLVQELFISMWKQDVTFTNIKALTTYLYRSSRNSALNYLKAKKVEEKRMEAFVSDTHENEHLDDSMLAIVEEEMIREMNYFISELPEERKKILLLSSRGLTVREVAEELDISVNTVKTQKKRAYAFLKEKLKDSIFLLMLFS